jgi:hypothetical protein
MFDDVRVDDAQLVDPRPPGMRRVEARHVLVWIRHEGAWRTGAIHCWFVHSDMWMAWMQHQPPDPDAPQAVWGLYVYDGVSIRRRHHPAARATVEVPSAWGPERVIQTRLRDLGYAVALTRTGDDTDVLLLG